ncbi:TPA: hypothetical protein EYP44_01350 [Candidatus Bathyarchaeota archaeon]|nr:hypothetical protein [Candidatus Bathyarchaeota archaeon]
MKGWSASSRRARKRLCGKIVSYWAQLFEHGMRDFVMPYDHIYKRQLLPLCRLLGRLTEVGTGEDLRHVIIGFLDVCRRRSRCRNRVLPR